MAKDTDTTSKIYRAKLITNLLILILALISLVILQIHRSGFWIYTLLMCVVVAILCVTLSGYVSSCAKSKQGLPFWREIIYWLGFLATVYVTSLMIQYGITTAAQSGLFALLALASALFFLGIMQDIAYLLSGIAIALMLTGSIIIHAYLLLVIIPIAIIMGFLIFLLLRKNPSTRKS